VEKPSGTSRTKDRRLATSGRAAGYNSASAAAAGVTTMRSVLQLLSWAALAATIVPALYYLAGATSLATLKTWMLWATVVWFMVTPLWMGRRRSP
jgi:hypothetical protein